METDSKEMALLREKIFILEEQIEAHRLWHEQNGKGKKKH